jgi:hypothetical protein
MPVDCGSITASNADAAIAASAAVPPARITSTATSAAAGCDVATIAFWAWTVERPAKWKFLIASLSFERIFGRPTGIGQVQGVSWHIRPGQGNGWHAREISDKCTKFPRLCGVS